MGKKLYVGNLPFTISELALNEMFAQSGVVESVRLITDRDTNRSKGFGFVEMGSDEEAKNAISSFHGTQLEGRQIVVSEARPMEKREGGFRPGRGAFRGGENSNPRSYDGGGGRRY